VSAARLELRREQILAFRRGVGALDERLLSGPESLRRAAWAGLQDSMPRAAVLSIHARVEGVGPDVWEDPALVQVWGPRFSAYVVAAVDRAVFTLGRMPDDSPLRVRAEGTARRIGEFLHGRRMSFAEVGHGLGVPPNSLRYAALTGTVLIRWDGARRPPIWTVPPPEMTPAEARLELARRYLHVFGPGTAAAFGEWAGLRPPAKLAAFEALAGELAPVRTPVGDAWILAADEAAFRAPARPAAPARLLPSGDAYFLLQGVDRDLLVADPACRARLWTPRVWPGAVLVEGEIVGTWRRSQTDFAIGTWRPLTPGQRQAVEAEAHSMPLPGSEQGVRVEWSD